MRVAWLGIMLMIVCLGRISAGDDRVNDPDASPQVIKTAVAKAIPLLLKGAKGHIGQRTCFACHNQATPLFALVTARTKGFPVKEEDIGEQVKFIARFLDKNRDNYLKGKGQGGEIDTAGYALLSLELGGWLPDQTTAAVANYILQYNRDRSHWRSLANRPPSEASDFTVTYLALRGLKRWGSAEQKEQIDKRIETARVWLVKTPARDTEDAVFRLLAMHTAGLGGKVLGSAREQLASAQREDGGWAQTDDMASDAYATGTALTALHLGGGMPTDSSVYRRGLNFLIQQQLKDGSWRVKSRSKPFQTYYESGFPHGKDQFISMAATGWAVTALSLACSQFDADREEAPLPRRVDR